MTVTNYQLPIANRETDWHCHILPGLDDGARNIAEAVEMARLLAMAGFREICCTPHHMHGVWNTSPDTVRSATAALQAELARAAIPVVLYPGMEYYLDEFLADILNDPLPLPGNLLLVELPTHCDARVAQLILSEVVKRGLTPLIAHPERCELFSRSLHRKSSCPFELLRSLFGNRTAKRDTETAQLSTRITNDFVTGLFNSGCHFQGDLGSLKGHYGPRVEQRARNLQSDGWYTHWGSDAHNAEMLMALFHRAL